MKSLRDFQYFSLWLQFLEMLFTLFFKGLLLHSHALGNLAARSWAGKLWTIGPSWTAQPAILGMRGARLPRRA
jgi:hypothetical protein